MRSSLNKSDHLSIMCVRIKSLNHFKNAKSTLSIGDGLASQRSHHAHVILLGSTLFLCAFNEDTISAENTRNLTLF